MPLFKANSELLKHQFGNMQYVCQEQIQPKAYG